MANPRTFSVTNSFVNRCLNIFNNTGTDGDKELETYARAEYKKDWQWALTFYRNHQYFPNSLRDANNA
jgi:hypothetical protein